MSIVAVSVVRVLKRSYVSRIACTGTLSVRRIVEIARIFKFLGAGIRALRRSLAPVARITPNRDAYAAAGAVPRGMCLYCFHAYSGTRIFIMLWERTIPGVIEDARRTPPRRCRVRLNLTVNRGK